MSWIKAAPLLLLVLTACEQGVASSINQEPIQTKRISKEITLNNDDDLQQVTNIWQRGGQSALHLVATYKPGDKGIAEHNAKTAAARLRNLGVSDITTETMQASSDQIIAHMTVLEASPAPGCSTAPGIGPLEDGYDYQTYRLGCSVDNFMGMQVAKTNDLEGRAPGEIYQHTTDAQRVGAIVDVFRTGKPNEPLKGLNSSEIAEKE